MRPPTLRIIKGIKVPSETQRFRENHDQTAQEEDHRSSPMSNRLGNRRAEIVGQDGLEFHRPGYQYMGPGTKLKKRLARGDPGINWLDRIAKQHDIDYSHAKSLKEKHVADPKMIQAITRLPGRKTWTEAIVKKIVQGKAKLNL